jgi:hypothetical protein
MTNLYDGSRAGLIAARRVSRIDIALQPLGASLRIRPPVLSHPLRKQRSLAYELQQREAVRQKRDGAHTRHEASQRSACLAALAKPCLAVAHAAGLTKNKHPAPDPLHFDMTAP